MSEPHSNRSDDSVLVLFTDGFPHGEHETFLEAEIPHLAAAFGEVRIIPRRAYPRGGRRELPSNVHVRPPVFDHPGRWPELLRGIRGRAPWLPFLREAWHRRVFLSGRRFRKWLEAWCVVRSLHRHPDFPFDAGGGRVVLYFYWGVGCSWILPFLPSGTDAVVRYHGHDLYEERADYRGYVPFREAQLRASRLAACISEHGLAYLRDRYAAIPFAAELHRLGVEDRGIAPWGPDPAFRIATCSRLVPLKRLDLLIEALSRLDFPVRWTHIGSGPLEQELKRRAAALPPNVTVEWAGNMPNDAVRRHYLEHPQDLFVNVSETEGLPVTVMEALNAGIPVMATDVGGTRELVDDQVGWLLPADLDAAHLAGALRDSHLAHDLSARRRAARQRWAERADEQANHGSFAQRLKGRLP